MLEVFDALCDIAHHAGETTAAKNEYRYNGEHDDMDG